MKKTWKKLKSDFPELFPENTADRTLVGHLADLDIPADWAEENFFPPHIFSGFYRIECFLIKRCMNLLSFHGMGESKHSITFTFRFCQLDKFRVHVGELVRLTSNAGFKVFLRGFDSSQHL